VNSRGETLNILDPGRRWSKLPWRTLEIRQKAPPDHATVELLARPLVWLVHRDPVPPLDEIRKILVLEQGHLGDVSADAISAKPATPVSQRAHSSFGPPGLKNLLEVQNSGE